MKTQTPPTWDAPPRDFDFESDLARALGIHPAVAAVLRARGLDTVEACGEFIAPDLGQLHDPFLLPDMSAAADRIVRAIEAKEIVLVHGDYDVDGITSTALMTRFLRKLGADVLYFIPHRVNDQYGLNVEAVRQAAGHGATLTVAVDCGVNAVEAIEETRRLGMDALVIDHHEPGERQVDALAVVDPKRADSQYPERDLAAVGLCFKTASAVCIRLGVPQESLERAFLDLVALGTVADVVPLVGENRVFTRFGLGLLAETRKVGLRALMQVCNITGAVRSSDVAFRLAPRMNAAGRMGDATDALELLLTDDEDEALRLALHLENSNRDRQREQEVTYRQALEQIEQIEELDAQKVLVLSSPQWHIGVVGIVASKIVERYYRPTIMLVETGDEARGSARSVDQFDISRGLEACSHLLMRHGGHALAAGLTLRVDQIGPFREAVNRAADSLDLGDIQDGLPIDAELLLDEVDEELLEGIEAIGPCGRDNPEPLFVTRGVDVVDARAVGRDAQHLKLLVSQGDRPVDCIAFNMAEELKWLKRGSVADVCHCPELNEYNGTRGIQLRLRGIRRSQD